jgi:hypothetical protein
MKKIIRLTESDLRKIFRLAIKENEEDWISQSQDIEGESDFGKIEVPRDLASNPNFKKLVSFFKRNPEEAEEMESELDTSLNEDYDYFDYGDTQPEKISREEFWKRKLRLFGLSAAFGAIMGMFMAGGPDADTVIEMALAMAAGTAVVSNTLISTVGREKKKDYYMGDEEDQDSEEPITEMEDETFMRGADKNWREKEDDDYKDRNMYSPYYGEGGDEEWGETDRGEQNLQDLLEEARDILENELGYSIDAINEMDEYDIVDDLHAHFYNELAYEIEHLLEKEGFDDFADEDEPYDSIGGHSVNDLKKAFAKTKSKDEELDEGWDDFVQKRRYPEDYKPEKYRRIPKGFLRQHSGRMIDPEGTILTKSDEDPFDEYTDFDDEEYA